MLTVDHFDFQLLLEWQIKYVEGLFNQLVAHPRRDRGVDEVEEAHINQGIAQVGEELGLLLG